MASIESEYRRFLVFLDRQAVGDDVRRLASLVHDNLGGLAEVGAARRARSTRLVPILERGLADAVILRAADLQQEVEPVAPFRLHQLVVGPFRGFMEQETFDLSRDITLIYGANGTGKSSFCEALETAMLGSINEAQAKRVDHQLYCNNARLRTHAAPELTKRAGQDAPTRLAANESEYQFCFIEKNRLDDFARIAAHTAGDQRQLLATLFGVDQFDDFVRGFNQSLDETLTLVGPLAERLKKRREELTTSEKVVRQHPTRLAELEQNEGTLAERIVPGQDYAAACAWLLGHDGQLGRLAQIQAQTDQPTPSIRGITVVGLDRLLGEVRTTKASLDERARMLNERASDVSFKQLYEAVSALSQGATSCPACGTSLDQVRSNPFENARRGLEDLAELAQMQEAARAQGDIHADAIRTLRAGVAAALTAAQDTLPTKFQEARLPQLPEASGGDWWTEWIAGDGRPWRTLLALVVELEDADARARAVIEARNALVQERQRLDALRLEVARQAGLREASQAALAAAEATIAGFDAANRELIEDVARESLVVTFHGRIKVAYDSFIAQLNAYLAGLPLRLVEGLNVQARDLYNSFNRGDPAGDLLHSLSLPQAQNEKILIEFEGERGRRFDALVVLSEGHIRCLGLAILMAKNIAQGCPVVIFDDVVNAIDDEHRDGIWRTFFEDGHLRGKQVILTSHAQEFLHRIQQELGAQVAGEMKRYKFLPHTGEHQLRVDSDPATKNYVLLAAQALAQDERRDALRHSRPALEALTDQLWKWLGSRGDGRIELKLAGPGSPWELNNKCLKLRTAVSRVVPQFPAAQAAVDALTALTGVNGNAIEWSYLNGGVHDAQRGHEFDAATVRTIVDAVTALDAALAALRNPAR